MDIDFSNLPLNVVANFPEKEDGLSAYFIKDTLSNEEGIWTREYRIMKSIEEKTGILTIRECFDSNNKVVTAAGDFKQHAQSLNEMISSEDADSCRLSKDIFFAYFSDVAGEVLLREAKEDFIQRPIDRLKKGYFKTLNFLKKTLPAFL